MKFLNTSKWNTSSCIFNNNSGLWKQSCVYAAS